jgi:hypothetical protein
MDDSLNDQQASEDESDIDYNKVMEPHQDSSDSEEDIIASTIHNRKAPKLEDIPVSKRQKLDDDF